MLKHSNYSVAIANETFSLRLQLNFQSLYLLILIAFTVIKKTLPIVFLQIIGKSSFIELQLFKKKITISMKPPSALLQSHNISKSFGSFIANDKINFNILEGEIHGLLGENGAGKSTFVKMVYGLLEPSMGEFFWNGNPIKIPGPQEARNFGIGMVFQHFSLFPTLTVIENIQLALSETQPLPELRKTIIEKSQEFGIFVDPDTYIRDLSVGEQQRVEILRCLLQNPKLLIMDEPTSVLTPQESQQLFKILKILAKTGCSVLFISHKLKEVKEITQRATILRRGQVVDTVISSEVSTGQLAKMMVGNDPQNVKQKIEHKSNKILVKIAGLCRPANTPFSTPLLDINLDVKAGEIVGIAGIAGNGQSELMEVLTGEWRSKDSINMLDVLGVDIRDYSPHRRRQMGIGFMPEERNGHSAVMNMTLTENTLLTNHNNPEIQKNSIIENINLENLTSNIIHDYDVRTPLQNPLASSLSGGNLQKFVVGRELIKKPRVFFVAQPTWGVDIGATKFIRNAIIELANEGCGIIVISQDLEELFELADSISVLFRGKLSERKPVKELNSQKIGLLMGGEDVSFISRGI